MCKEFLETVGIGNQFTSWVKTDPRATLVRLEVGVQKATAVFASHKKGDTIHLLRRTASTKNVPNRSPVQKRLSINNWNSGPRRGKEDAF